MVWSVVQDHAEIDHGKAGEISAARGILNSLLDRGNVVFRDRSAEDVVDEFELPTARQRFNFNLAVAILAVSASLLLVPSLHVSFAANSLAIGNFWRLQNYFSVITLLEFGDHDFNVLLPGARNQEFLGLGIAEKSQHGVFFHQLVNARPQLVFIGAAFGLDRKRNGGLRPLLPRVFYRRRFFAARVLPYRVFLFS